MQKVIFIISLSLIVLHGFPAIADMEAIFSSEGSIKETLLREMETTHSTLDLAVHGIASLDMANALLKAKQRGVKVRIVADSKQAKAKFSLITHLINQGISVKVLGGKDKEVMNHRFAIFDRKKVVTGSYDWAEASEKWNFENILILGDSEIAESYQKEFDRLWREKRIIK